MEEEDNGKKGKWALGEEGERGKGDVGNERKEKERGMNLR